MCGGSPLFLVVVLFLLFVSFGLLKDVGEIHRVEIKFITLVLPSVNFFSFVFICFCLCYYMSGRFTG